MKTYFILISLLLFGFCIAPASALIYDNTHNLGYLNNSAELVSASFIHDSNYWPVEFWYLLIGIAFLCWILSVFAPKAEDIFCIITPITFAIIAWITPYVSIEKMMALVVADNSTGIPKDTVRYVYSQVITPEPILQAFFVFCTILSLCSGIYLVFLYKTDKSLVNYDTKEKI